MTLSSTGLSKYNWRSFGFDYMIKYVAQLNIKRDVQPRIAQYCSSLAAFHSHDKSLPLMHFSYFAWKFYSIELLNLRDMYFIVCFSSELASNWKCLCLCWAHLFSCHSGWKRKYFWYLRLNFPIHNLNINPLYRGNALQCIRQTKSEGGMFVLHKQRVLRQTQHIHFETWIHHRFYIRLPCSQIA